MSFVAQGPNHLARQPHVNYVLYVEKPQAFVIRSPRDCERFTGSRQLIVIELADELVSISDQDRDPHHRFNLSGRVHHVYPPLDTRYNNLFGCINGG